MSRMADPRFLGTDARAPMSGARRGTIYAVAVTVAAAVLVATVSGVKPFASAASFDVPSVTWTQMMGSRELGSDRCWLTATTQVSDDSGMIAAVATLESYDIPYERDGNTVTVRSSLFDCDMGGTEPTADVSTADEPAANVLALGKNNVAIWILGGVVGTVIAVAAALFGGPIVAAAASAVGVNLTSSAAGIIAGCIGGALGGAVGEYLKGNDAPRMATSAILNCAGGTIVGLFKSEAEAAKVAAESAFELATSTETQISAAVSRTASSFNTALPGLAAEAATVADQAVPLESAALGALRSIASS